MSVEEEPRYRVRQVVELTGIPAPTLRAWERRYGVPLPERSAGGYRLYSPRDVEAARWMRQLIDSGVPASEAARRAGSESPPAVAVPPSSGSALASHAPAVAEAAFEAVTRLDPERLERLLVQLEGTLPAPALFEEFFAPLMRRVGDAWHAGDLSVAHEHLASTVVDRQLGRLLGSVQPLTPRGTVLLACVAGERHLIALQGAALRLAHQGYRTVLLGADTPPEAVAAAVERLRPTLVGLSLTTVPEVPDVAAFLAAYARAVGDTRWVVGGAASGELEGLVRELGGDVGPNHPGWFGAEPPRLVSRPPRP